MCRKCDGLQLGWRLAVLLVSNMLAIHRMQPANAASLFTPANAPSMLLLMLMLILS
jgi:hypothetical protein